MEKEMEKKFSSISDAILWMEKGCSFKLFAEITVYSDGSSMEIIISQQGEHFGQISGSGKAWDAVIWNPEYGAYP